MPKNRKKPGTRSLEKRLFIVCEGMKDKSESAYFKALIKDRRFAGDKVVVKVHDTNKNTGKELVKEAKKLREFKIDDVWVVYDKDGYTKHADTFSQAKDSNINIAFSSISFEVWILLHFEYTTKCFSKSEEVIKYLRDKKYIDYSKSSESIYVETREKIDVAIEHSKRIQDYQKKGNPVDTPKYTYGMYTDLDKLIEAIDVLQTV